MGNFFSTILESMPSTQDITQAYHNIVWFFNQFQTQPQMLPDRNIEKIGRKVIPFKDNKTPALTLPDRPKYKEKPCEKGFFTLFSATSVPTKNSPKVFDGNVPIEKRILDLQSEINARIEADQKAKIDDLELQRVDEVWEQIIEHARMRGQIFFYLMVAMYGEGVTFNKDSTRIQHGKGNKAAKVDACHCSLFPNYKLDPIPSIWLPTVILNFTSQQKPRTFKGTHFGEVLNTTTALPRSVNEFDMNLEGKVKDPSNPVRHMINILNMVSLAKIDPRTGMDEYYKNMDAFFKDFEKDLSQEKLAQKYPKAMRKIGEYQKIGTFEGANAEHTAMSDDYFNLLMGFNPEAANDLRWKMFFYGWAKTPEVLTKQYTKLKDDIFKPLKAEKQEEDGKAKKKKSTNDVNAPKAKKQISNKSPQGHKHQAPTPTPLSMKKMS